MDRNAILTGNEAGLLAYFDCTEGLGLGNLGTSNTLADKTGNGNNGLASGYVERGLVFDGVNDQVTVPDTDELSITGDFTLEAWVKPTDFNGFNAIVSKVNVIAFPTPYDFYLLSGSGLPNVLVGNGGTFDSATGLVAPTPGQWNHLAVVRSGNTITHYLNGVPNGTGTITQPTLDGDMPFIIGGRVEQSIWMRGALDDVRVWNVARSQAEINDKYQDRLIGNENGLVAYYPFTDSPGFDYYDASTDKIQDKSSNALHGTPLGFTSSYPQTSSWAFGAPVSGTDTDGDGVGDRCDLCQGDDATGDTDMDGICDDIDPDTPVTCDGSVISIDAITYSLSGDDVRASETITTNGSVIVPDGAEVTYTAGTSITLKPGFQAQGIFTARIDDCTPVVQTSVPSEEDAMTTIDWRIPDEEIGELDMMLFPNPTFGEVTTQYFLPKGGPVNLVLFDAQGRYVKSLMENWPQDAGRHQVQWQTNRLADGMYWVQIRTTAGVLVQKLLVHKP